MMSPLLIVFCSLHWNYTSSIPASWSSDDYIWKNCTGHPIKVKLGKWMRVADHVCSWGVTFYLRYFVPIYRDEIQRCLAHSSSTALIIGWMSIVQWILLCILNIIFTVTGSLRIGIDWYRITSEMKFSTHWAFWPYSSLRWSSCLLLMEMYADASR